MKNKKDTKKESWITRIKSFLEQAKGELKKVTYPSQRDVLVTCGSVIFIVIIISLFLGVVDIVLAKIINFILPK